MARSAGRVRLVVVVERIFRGAGLEPLSLPTNPAIASYDGVFGRGTGYPYKPQAVTRPLEAKMWVKIRSPDPPS